MNELTDAQIKTLDCTRIDTDWQGTAFWIVPESVLEFARKVIAADRALCQAEPAERKLQKVLQTLNENGFEPVQPAAQAEFTSSTYDPPGLSNWLIGHDKGVRVTHRSGAFEQCHTERGVLANEAAALERLKERLAAQPAKSTSGGDSHRRMLEAACVDLGLINEALGLDPNEGGGKANY